MDLTPDTVRRVAFRESWRGYNQVDVDHFIEWVAAGLEAMSRADHIPPVLPAEQEERALIEDLPRSDTSAVSLAAPPPPPARPEAPSEKAPPPDAVAAEARAREVLARAEREAAELTERVRRRLRQEMAVLERDRDALSAQVEALTRHLAGERARLREALATAARQLSREFRLDVPAPGVATSDAGNPEPGPSRPDDTVVGDTRGLLGERNRQGAHGRRSRHG